MTIKQMLHEEKLWDFAREVIAKYGKIVHHLHRFDQNNSPLTSSRWDHSSNYFQQVLKIDPSRIAFVEPFPGKRKKVDEHAQ